MGDTKVYQQFIKNVENFLIYMSALKHIGIHWLVFTLWQTILFYL